MIEITREEIAEEIARIVVKNALRKVREKKGREGMRRERPGEFFCKKKMAVKYWDRIIEEIDKNRLIKLEREMKILKNSFDKYHLNDWKLIFGCYANENTKTRSKSKN